MKGVNKDYIIVFHLGLNIIVGPIYTGKSTILKLIDYCLGKGNHPEYKELSKVSTILLEMIIYDELLTIERQLFAKNKKVIIHHSSIDNLEAIHRKIEVYPSQKKNKESISSFLMKSLNLWGIPLKESIVGISSGVDIMSLRDLMWFCYLDQNRIDDDKHFLYENEHYKNIKFRQIFKVLFNIHDNKEASLSEQLKEKKREKEELINKIEVLTDFLETNRIPSKQNLLKTKETLDNKLVNAQIKYDNLTKEHQNLISFSDDFRKDLTDLEKRINQEKSTLRDKKILQEKMLTLLGQYEEDIRRIEALIEAKNLIEPLKIVRCPICLGIIKDNLDNSRCKLCNSEIPKLEISQFENPSTELSRLKKKHKEILDVIKNLEIEISNLNHDIKIDDRSFSEKSIELEKRIESIISPLTTLREQKYSRIQEIKLENKDILEKIEYYNIIEENQKDLGKVISQINRLEKEIKDLREKVVKPYEEILRNFSEIFYEILESLKFPKLDKNVIIEKDLTPYVRDTSYRSQGSLGATVLITQAWYIALFRLLSEFDSKHPKFYLIDSPQKNIGLNTKEVEYKDAEIIYNIYKEYKKLADEKLLEQLIIVDNAPPEGYENFYTIKFTRDPKIPPYGLIDDEISIIEDK